MPWITAQNVTCKGLYCQGYRLCVTKWIWRIPGMFIASDLDTLMHLTWPCRFLPPQPSSFSQAPTLQILIMMCWAFQAWPSSSLNIYYYRFVHPALSRFSKMESNIEKAAHGFSESRGLKNLLFTRYTSLGEKTVYYKHKCHSRAYHCIYYHS